MLTLEMPSSYSHCTNQQTHLIKYNEIELIKCIDYNNMHVRNNITSVQLLFAWTLFFNHSFAGFPNLCCKLIEA
jgi:hypothetical protein